MEEKETKLKRRRELEREARQNESEIQKEARLEVYLCLAFWPIQCYASPSYSVKPVPTSSTSISSLCGSWLEDGML